MQGILDDAAVARMQRRALALAGGMLERLSPVGRALNARDVHRIRVACKRLRGFWQAQRPALGAALPRERDRALRGAARGLAAHREAHVLRSTLIRVTGRHALGDDDVGAMDALLDVLRAGHPDTIAEPRASAALRATFEDECVALAGLASAVPPSALADGMLRCYGRARKAGRRALRGGRGEAAGADEDWHRCRRWVKYELYQLELIARRRAPRGRLRRLEAFGEQLGHFHDLCDLRAVADGARETLAERGAAATAARVLSAADRELRGGLPGRFRRLYGRDVDARARRLRRWMRR